MAGCSRRGPKPAAHGMRGVASAQNPLVCDTMVAVLERGGSAADAAVAGALAAGVVENCLTSYGGLVTCLYRDAATADCHQLTAIGAFPPGLPPFRPVPDVGHLLTQMPPAACIPGFMPGLGALHARFGRLPWADLCAPALELAEAGFVMSPDTYATHLGYLPFLGYFPAGRALLAPTGFVTPVGERFRNPALADTLRRLAAGGPAEFTEGAWAKAFVALANDLGWPIRPEHMRLAEARWEAPLAYAHRGHTVRQLAPPNAGGVLCLIALGVLERLGIEQLAPDSAERFFYLGHVLRWANREIGLLGDPAVFDPPLDVWRDPAYHASIARVIAGTRPKLDLTDHVKLTAGPLALAALGMDERVKRPLGSSELSVVDADGNWCQLMNTLQSGGIPGQVVGGVAMFGSHATFGNSGSVFDQWLAPGVRMRAILGNTQVFRDGEPVLQLGASGAVHANTLQALSGILDHGLAVEAAIAAPRMLPLGDDNVLPIEGRVPPEAVAGLARMGVRLRLLQGWDTYMGSFHACWREPGEAGIRAWADPRFTGVARAVA